MSTNSIVVAVVGVGVIVAAGAGSYLAVRSSLSEPVAATQQAPAPGPVAEIGTSVRVDPPVPAPPPAEAAAAPTDRRSVPPERPKTSTPRADQTVSRSAPSPAPTVSPASPPAPAVVPAAPAPTEVTPPPASAPVVEPPAAQESSKPQADAKPRFEEVTVKEDSVIGIQFESAVTTETARVEDRVAARVSRDVTLDGRTVIPAGATLEGSVTLVERGGKFKDRARLGVRFTTLVLADNTRLPIQTETIFRDGESPTQEASAKIGASAVVGAILGAVIGGKKGAVIGSTAGAAGGTAAVVSGGRNEAAIAAGTPLTVRLVKPVTVLIERD